MTRTVIKLLAAASGMVFGLSAMAQSTQSPAGSTESELETLRSQLAARQAINEQLSRRIDNLEKQLAATSNKEGTVTLGLDASFPKPAADTLRADSITAIEEALVTKGLVLMLSGTLRATPSLSWGHNGSGVTRADSYAASTTLDVGLPGGMAATVTVPYIWRKDPSGNNSGVGDATISIAKKLSNETDTLPSFVGRLSYTHDGGKDPFTLPSVGSGFRSYGVSLSAVKRVDPLVLYGNIFYAHAVEKIATVRLKNSGTILFQGKIAPGDSYGLGMGVSLIATPEIALDAGLSLSFANSSRYDLVNSSLYLGGTTIGYLNLGTNILLTKNMSLSIGAAAGVTKEASDFALTVALPYRF